MHGALALRFLASAALLLLPAATSLAAQTRVYPGERVRAVAPRVADTTLTGRVLEVDSASLLLSLSLAQAPVRLPVRGISQLEVSRGRRSHGRDGLAIGAVLGGVIAGMAAKRSDCRFVCGPVVFYSALGGVLGGGLGGYVVGRQFREGPERWRPVDLPRTAHGPQPSDALAPPPVPSGR